MTIDLEIQREQSADLLWDLLLLADPSRQMVEEYLREGTLYSARWDGVTIGVYVLVPIEDDEWELKNIAVAPEWQGKGVGKALVSEALKSAKEQSAKTLIVGTGNSSVGQLALYQKAGFRMDRIAKNFFTLNYDEPIYENGIQCRDMVFLKMELES